MTTVEVLKAAKAKIEDPQNWCKQNNPGKGPNR